MQRMMRVTVRYSAGPYSGTRTVEALDTETAIAIVCGLVRREMTLPMYSDSYRVESVSDDPFEGLARSNRE